MIVVLQRVHNASVTVDKVEIARIGRGLVAFACVVAGDSETSVRWCARKIVNMRIFDDEHGKMNLALSDVDGAVLAVSQFTLGADVVRGRRPGFERVMTGREASARFDEFTEELKANAPTQTGRFGAHMTVSLTNDGPATFILDSESSSRK